MQQKLEIRGFRQMFGSYINDKLDPDLQKSYRPVKVGNSEMKEFLSGTLGFEPVERLLPHERTTDDGFATIKDQIAGASKFTWPLSIDCGDTNGEYKLVIDGMHRRKYLVDSGYATAFVQRFNYMDPEVQLTNWCRAMDDVGEAEFKAAVDALGSIVPADGARPEIFYEAGGFVVDGHKDVRGKYEHMQNLFLQLGIDKRENKKVYMPQEDAKRMVGNSRTVVGITPTLEKKHVLEVGGQNRAMTPVEMTTVFPEKSTRNLMPQRVVRLVNCKTLDMMNLKRLDVERLEDELRSELDVLGLFYFGYDITKDIWSTTGGEKVFDRTYAELVFTFCTDEEAEKIVRGNQNA